jgi:hypothetical protein
LTEVDIGEKVELIYVRNGNEMKATAEIGKPHPNPNYPKGSGKPLMCSRRVAR